MGYCTVKSEGLHEKVEVCEEFRKASLEELREVLRREGWLYCITCEKTIVDEEDLEKHLKEHIIVADIVIDEAVTEEAPSAD